ncbi:MAG: hypothetical protein Q8881_03755 [Sweet potato little leaf phytoplasma]|nr:hypothetical protein [Sweet potato little leaf phytoplasma]
MTNLRRISYSRQQNGRISAEFRTRGRFPRNGRISAEFAVKNVSDETVESIPPNFTLGSIPTKRPNFRRISHSGTFPPKRANQSRQILHSGRFRRNGRINPAEFLPNFALGDVSDETADDSQFNCLQFSFLFCVFLF